MEDNSSDRLGGLRDRPPRSATIAGVIHMKVGTFSMLFHGSFFPGKDNWLFDPAADPVIVLLPEEFFRNCAIAIGVSLLGLCLLLLFTGRRQKK